MKFVVFAALASAAFCLAPGATAQKPAAKPAPSVAKAKAAPLFCVITGEDIANAKAAAGKTVYKGKTVYFCCPGCIGRFNKASDPQKAAFVKANDLRVKQAVAGKPTATEAEPMKHAEGEMHHNNSAAKSTSGKSGLTCPVTGEAITSVADATGGKSEYNGKTYYFCCPGCKTKFDAAPAKYAAK